jgi:hypothetical protein
VAAWVEDMLRRITEDLKLLLQHIDMEHRDDVTYRGRSYLKILRVLTTRGPPCQTRRRGSNQLVCDFFLLLPSLLASQHHDQRSLSLQLCVHTKLSLPHLLPPRP